jgi:rare lipoprotein A
MWTRALVLFALMGITLHCGLGCSTTPRYRVNRGLDAVQTGIASYYGLDYHGRQTASGEIFDMHGLTAAHTSLPFGTKIKVTNLDNDRQVIVRVNDRGPFVKGRVLDLSYGAAKELDMIESGTAPVRIEVLEFGEGR